MADSISDVTRESVKHLRHGLLRLHKMLLDQERVGYERARGKIGNSYEFLQLVLKDPWFDWLHRLSELIVQMDEALDARDPDHPTTDEDAEALIAVSQSTEPLQVLEETLLPLQPYVRCFEGHIWQWK